MAVVVTDILFEILGRAHTLEIDAHG